MRINFHPSTSNTTVPEWLVVQRIKWLTEYDMDTQYTNKFVVDYIWSPAGAKNFAFWLQGQGFKIEYWEIDYIPEHHTVPIAYGIKFDSTDPKIVYEQLKQ